MATDVTNAVAAVEQTVMVTILAVAAAIEASAVEAGGAVMTVGLDTTLLWCLLRWFL